MPSGRVVSAFLEKTFKLISAPETDGIVDWTKDGRTFIVKRPKEFSETVLPKFFRHSKFSSFVRQLNFYGFHKLRTDETGTLSSGKLDQTQETGWWEFKHEYFQRGKRELLSKIKRKTYSDDDKSEMERLRSDVEALKTQVAELTQSLTSLSQLMTSGGGATPSASTTTESLLDVNGASKKRKLETAPPVTEEVDYSSAFFGIPPDFEGFMADLGPEPFVGSLFEAPSLLQPRQGQAERDEGKAATSAVPRKELSRSTNKRAKIESELQVCDLRLKQNPDDVATASYKAILLEHLGPLLTE